MLWQEGRKATTLTPHPAWRSRQADSPDLGPDDIEQALKKAEFTVLYQPQLRLLTDRLCGLEAFLHWQHPRLGLLPGEAFIPLAERCGLIEPVGFWMLRRVAADFCGWRARGHRLPKVAVSLWTSLFSDPRLVFGIREILTENGIGTEDLAIGITDELLGDDHDFGQSLLREFHECGIGIILDRFRVGGRRLTHIKRYGINQININHDMINNLMDYQHTAAMVSTIICLSHSLNLAVNAKGVESLEQLGYLKSERCDQVQGNLFSPPRPTADIERFLVDSYRFEPSHDP